jgi:hypothetical protein
VHLLVDSTGLKLGGGGEWLVEKHGTPRRRSWRKLHIGVDAESGEMVAIEPAPTFAGSVSLRHSRAQSRGSISI